MISVIVLDTSAARDKRAVLLAAEKFMKALGLQDKLLELFLVGSKQMDKNVLSFTADPAFPRPDVKAPPLGELYLNPRYIKNHGEDLYLMLAHGLLHLIGFDHESARDRIKMEQKERELLLLLKKR